MKQRTIVLAVACVLGLFIILTLSQISDSSSSTKKQTIVNKKNHQHQEQDEEIENDVMKKSTQDRQHKLLFDDDSTLTPASPSSSMFTIVVLTYKAPKSLSETLKSLATTNIINHPNLKQIIVYFQAFDRTNDRKLVHTLSKQFYKDKESRIYIDLTEKERKDDDDDNNNNEDDRAKNSFVRVTGREANLPVAKATFTALSYVTTPLVMYLECDRPAYAYYQKDHDEDGNSNNNQKQQQKLFAFTRALIDTAISYVTSKRADVFRLQVYANHDLSSSSSSSPSSHALPRITYGDGDLAANCDRAPTLTKKECHQAKQNGNRVFYTAYCKHWAKLMNEKETPQQDLCDSVCFAEWEKMMMTMTGMVNQSSLSSSSKLSFEGPRQKFRSALVARRRISENDIDDIDHDDDVLCTTSEWCNWTNQPTMYLKRWYEDNIKAPCLASPQGCVGVPGRKSAVLQEIFFVKNRNAWRGRKHKICLHRKGLFYHFEIDNREK